MAAFISGKQRLVILLGGLIAAAGVVCGLTYLLNGPRLGLHYDLLRGLREAPPEYRDIVLIETGDIIESGDVFNVLMTLSECDASSLIIEVPVLGSASNRMYSDEEINQRLNDEYTLLGSNIRNLFEAIRVGTVPPDESPEYVENLVELANRGRDRLSAALRQEEADVSQIVRSAGVFGNVLEADDLRSADRGSADWYSRPRPDSDGKLRRVAPRDPDGHREHIVYRSLKPRWENSGVADGEWGRVFTAGEFHFPLDKNGNILIEEPRAPNKFRRIAIEHIRAYAEADRVMRRLLKDAEPLGIYSELTPERIPPILYDYALGLQDDLAKMPSESARTAWIHARSEYMKSLHELFTGPVEATLIGAYEEIIATETLRPEGLARLRRLRDDLILAFEKMRAQYRELEEIRGELRDELNASLCIMGPADSAVVEASVLCANTLLTGRRIAPAGDIRVLVWSIAAVFVLLVLIHFLRPGVLLITGTLAGLVCAAGFGWRFIITAEWIDPLIPALSCLAGTLVMFISGAPVHLRAARKFRAAYQPAVYKDCLAQLMRTGTPRLTETLLVRASVIAVKNSALASREYKDNPLAAARAMREFRAAASAPFQKAGAVLIGCTDDTVLMCFGSPLERIYLEHRKKELQYADESNASGNHPAIRAAGCITELVHTCPAAWCFGVDFGECAFSWSAETGYAAVGPAVSRARSLGSLAIRHSMRILITGAIEKKISQPVRKLQISGISGGKENFYELRNGE